MGREGTYLREELLIVVLGRGGAGKQAERLGGSELGEEGEDSWVVGEVQHVCRLLGKRKKGQGEGRGVEKS